MDVFANLEMLFFYLQGWLEVSLGVRSQVEAICSQNAGIVYWVSSQPAEVSFTQKTQEAGVAVCAHKLSGQ